MWHSFNITRDKRIILINTLYFICQLVSTSKVLTSLRHPQSVVPGEEVVLEVHLFNNQERETKVNFNLCLVTFKILGNIYFT